MTTARAKHWCFTLNNYTDNDIDRLNGLKLMEPRIDDSISYMVYGKEVGKEGTPHLQGFVSFLQRKRISQLKKIIGKAHFTVARYIEQSIAYCKKDKNFTEIGQPPLAKKSDISIFKEAVRNERKRSAVVSETKMREEHSLIAAKYPQFFRDYIKDVNMVMDKEEEELPELRQWQEELKRMLDGEIQKRKIIFVVDTVGGQGKTAFAHYYRKLNPETTQIIIPGKKADMAFTYIPTTRVIFFDCPRSKQGDFIQYDFLEEIKNGYIFSGKYESRIISFNAPHVVVLMNEQPDDTKLSADRYHIINLED